MPWERDNFAGGETIWELADTSPAFDEASIRRWSGRHLDGDMRGSRCGTIPQSAGANLGMAGFERVTNYPRMGDSDSSCPTIAVVNNYGVDSRVTLC